ncbi:universal stress protein [Streptomyces sp. ISL-36]|uniref:universal stress protein n=1 Tax=Streptomyces sp. ISL-36 TaxID=2819182 RepID=UPI001BEAC1FE|nr:universal stress protein [Streptomyces sp. ISL-36]MBT2444061.1 universal stress protein [Streptomyces sp. ISL-36]
MGREIVAGVDGSPESLAAADWAAREARHRRLPLRLVHAWRWEPIEIPLEQDRESQGQVADTVLREASSALAERYPGLALTGEVLTDTPVTALLSTEERAEMLVIGSRGYGAVAGFLLGSYGQQIIAAATRPVVAVRSRDGEAGRPDPAGGEIVVGQLGGAEDSEPALRFAFETAAARGASVRAVRAWSLPPLYAYGQVAMAPVDEAGGLVPYEEKALRDALAPWRERFPEVRVDEHVEMGSAGQVLLSVSGGAQLLVVGRRARRGAIGPRIGSVAHAALHLAPCPVAVVPQG